MQQPSVEEWEEAYLIAKQQTLLSFLLPAVDALCRRSNEELPDVLLTWIGESLKIKHQHQGLTRGAKKLYQRFAERNIQTCLLKGVGIAKLYPVPENRQSGDIDLWVKGGRKNVIATLKEMHVKLGNVVIHHVDAKFFSDVSTEIHFMPTWLYNPVHNRCLQQFFKEVEDEQFNHYDGEIGFCISTNRFNVVFLLVHIFHHLLEEGIGLRQIVDYYYLMQNLSKKERFEGMETLKKIGMGKFSSATMYVLQEVCGIDDSLLLCQPNERVGRFVLNEIMQTGNFGQYDNRCQKRSHENALERNIRKYKRQLSFLEFFPSEVMAIPCWKLWHWCWRKKKGYL